jgi:hypothetical protein
MLEHAAHLTMAALCDDDAHPVIGTLTPRIFKTLEFREPILQFNPVKKPLTRVIRQLAQNTDCIFPLHTGSRMHETVGQFTRCGEKEESLGVEIEATNGNPAPELRRGELLEHGHPMLRVVAGNDLTDRLVIREDTNGWRCNPDPNGLAVDLDLIGVEDPLPDMGWHAVDRHTASKDELFHLAP